MKKLLSLLFAALLLQACSANNQSNQPLAEEETNQTPKICQTLSADQIQNILDTDNYSENPVEQISEGAEGCKYIALDDESDNPKTFNFILRTAETPDQTKSEFYRAVNVWQNSNLNNREYSYIKNLGDDSFWSYNEKAPQLITYQNVNLLIVTLGNLETNKETALAKAKTVTSILLEKL